MQKESTKITRKMIILEGNTSTDHLVPRPEYEGVFYVKWPDGTQTTDFYNLTRANDIFLHFDGYQADMKKRTDLQGNKRASR